MWLRCYCVQRLAAILLAEKAGQYHGNRFGKKVLDWEEGIDRLLEFTQKKYPQIIKYIEGWVASVIWHIAIDQLIFTDIYPQHARRIQEKYGRILKNSWKLPVVSQARRVKSTLFMLSPACYRFMRKGWRALMKK